jgi:hypothetical protein
MACATEAKSADLFREAMEPFQTAIKNGVELQQESIRRCTDILRDFGVQHGWEKETPNLLNQAILSTQQTINDSIRVTNQNAQRALAILQKAFEEYHAQDGSGGSEAVEGVWSFALSAMRSNAQVIVQANGRVVELWANLAKEVNSQIESLQAEVRAAADEAMSQK